MNKNQTYKKVVTTLIGLAIIASPLSVNSASEPIPYNDLSRSEQIAYLYGMIAQIKAILDLRERLGYSDYHNVTLTREVNSTSRNVRQETLSATYVKSNEANIRGRLDLRDERSASVWLEYGKRSNDLNLSTRKQVITDTIGEIQIFSVNIKNLRSDTKYYFRAVAEDVDGARAYGLIRSFTTDKYGVSSRNSSGYSLDTKEYSVRAGDEVEIDWEIPSRVESSSNWVGLYKRGDSNNKYISWKYLGNADNGTVSFRIYKEGEYEVRLFLNNSYDDEVTSSRITVN